MDRLRKFVVICEWIDREDDSHCDADEVQVRAKDAASAVSAAREKWTNTIGAEWPSVRLEKAWILTRARRLSLT